MPQSKKFWIEFPKTPRTDELIITFSHTAAFFKLPDFVLDEGATKEKIQDLSIAASKKNNEEEKQEVKDKNPKDEDIDTL